jgi:hypothetical protein
VSARPNGVTTIVTTAPGWTATLVTTAPGDGALVATVSGSEIHVRGAGARRRREFVGVFREGRREDDGDAEGCDRCAFGPRLRARPPSQ